MQIAEAIFVQQKDSVPSSLFMTNSKSRKWKKLFVLYEEENGMIQQNLLCILIEFFNKIIRLIKTFIFNKLQYTIT